MTENKWEEKGIEGYDQTVARLLRQIEEMAWAKNAYFNSENRALSLAKELAEKDEVIAKLKMHAENMCSELQVGDGGFNHPVVESYRRDFQR